ncbi:ThiF family adenylyltransferase [Mycobacterium sp. SMC-4]|uniref:ThiF family adenylyltransferase n=1 Tax=Mycobacterium sp. SMC-4 TaxID=2857059 RepID=UPI003D03EFE4
MHTYDDAAYDRFRAGLIEACFSPVPGEDPPIWTGPIRPSLRPLTDATRMQIHFYPGWPLRYAHVHVDGLRTEHDALGTICLWGEDDPAQIDGRRLEALWVRLDQWAHAASTSFSPDDAALDAAHLFRERSNTYRAELPLQDLLDKGTTGWTASVFGTLQGSTLLIAHGNPPDPRTAGTPVLTGATYLLPATTRPPRTLDDARQALGRRQRRNLEAGLARRSNAAFPAPSGGHDFIVLTWPRHGADYDAVVLAFSGDGTTLQTTALTATANDAHALRRRAGPDADVLATKAVLIAGAGSVGGHVAVTLASNGVGALHLHDDDHLVSANLVRHVSERRFVGHRKTLAVADAVNQHAPWTTVTRHGDLPYDPIALRTAITDTDLVIDCTGILPMTAALAHVCHHNHIDLVTGALFHQGALTRIQRQTSSDTPLATRSADPRYHDLPRDDDHTAITGFLELGCTAPVNNASPAAVLTAAADITAAAIDVLTDRLVLPDERITVLRPLHPPFDRPGVIDPRPHD